MLRMSRLWLTVMLLVVFSIVLSFSVDSFAGATAALTATPSTAGKAPAGLIAFDSDRSGNSEIYVMRPDGSGLSQITNNPASDKFPAWSPDGKHIVFSSDRDGRRDLYVINANGSGIKRLTTTGSADEIAPAWSPDGKKIAYFLQIYDPMSDTGSPPNIYVMNADGTKQSLLFDSATQNLKLAAGLTWSPDSKKMAFGALKDDKSDLFTIDADGTNMTQFTSSDGTDLSPAWSPDGKKIAFMSAQEIDGKPTLRIFVINRDGSNVQALTPSDTYAASPTWSPDGTRLIFIGLDVLNSKVNAANVYVMDADGNNAKQLTQEQYLDASPSWSSAVANLKLPLPTFVPQPTPKGSTANCPISPDKTYGYTEDNPINVGGGDFGGPTREDAYMAQLRGPKGEKITSERTGSFPRPSDTVILDIYVVTYPGHSQSITLYVNEYDNTPPLIPVGFSCAPAK